MSGLPGLGVNTCLGCSWSCVAGCANGCKQTCINGCANHCEGDCGHSSCQTSCHGFCIGGCYQSCVLGCANGCKEECTTTCKDTCDKGCKYSCRGYCSGGCRGGCGGCDTSCTSCTGNCHGGCYKACTGACESQCTGGAMQSISSLTISSDKKMLSSTMNSVVNALKYEIQKRKISGQIDFNYTQGVLIDDKEIQNLIKGLALINKTVSQEAIEGKLTQTALLNEIINKIKSAWSETVAIPPS